MFLHIFHFFLLLPMHEFTSNEFFGFLFPLLVLIALLVASFFRQMTQLAYGEVKNYFLSITNRIFGRQQHQSRCLHSPPLWNYVNREFDKIICTIFSAYLRTTIKGYRQGKGQDIQLPLNKQRSPPYFCRKWGFLECQNFNPLVKKFFSVPPLFKSRYLCKYSNHTRPGLIFRCFFKERNVDKWKCVICNP